MGVVGVSCFSGEVDSGEERPERRVAIDEGSDKNGAVFDEGAEGEEEKREEEECWEERDR